MDYRTQTPLLLYIISNQYYNKPITVILTPIYLYWSFELWITYVLFLQSWNFSSSCIMYMIILILSCMYNCVLTGLWTAGDPRSHQHLGDLVQFQQLQTEKPIPSSASYVFANRVDACFALVNLVMNLCITPITYVWAYVMASQSGVIQQCKG